MLLALLQCNALLLKVQLASAPSAGVLDAHCTAQAGHTVTQASMQGIQQRTRVFSSIDCAALC